MRIISGNLKGKKLSFLSSSTTRPLKDIVKESIFNVIAHSNLINVKIKNSNILDLYSGIGSFGIECISREAKNVTFVENNEKALMALNENLKKLSVQNKALLFSKEIKEFLNQINKNVKFDIVFLDPPFLENKFINDLKLIKKLKILKKNHLIIIHREKKIIENLDSLFKTLLTKNYGRSKIIFGIF